MLCLMENHSGSVRQFLVRTPLVAGHHARLCGLRLGSSGARCAAIRLVHVCNRAVVASSEFVRFLLASRRGFTPGTLGPVVYLLYNGRGPNLSKTIRPTRGQATVPNLKC